MQKVRAEFYQHTKLDIDWEGLYIYTVYKVPTESLLEDVNAAIITIPIVTITETNKLTCTTAAVIL